MGIDHEISSARIEIDCVSQTILHHQKIDACFEAVKKTEPTILSYKIVAKTPREHAEYRVSNDVY